MNPRRSRGKDGEWDQRGLIHGQGYENVGQETYVYYGSWDLSGASSVRAIGLATMRRDGFGYLSTCQPGEGQFTTAPIPKRRKDDCLYLNDRQAWQADPGIFGAGRLTSEDFRAARQGFLGPEGCAGFCRFAISHSCQICWIGGRGDQILRRLRRIEQSFRWRPRCGASAASSLIAAT